MFASQGHCCSRFVGSTLPSPPLVFSAVLLSSCSLTADRWPNFRCLHPPFSLHYCSVCYRFHILVDTLTLAQFSLPSSCVLADLASCSPRRAIAVPASSAPTLSSPPPVSSPAFLSSCSLTADRWPNFRCLHPPFSLHYCSVCYRFHILVDSCDPCSFSSL